jgi:hypothetical protein
MARIAAQRTSLEAMLILKKSTDLIHWEFKDLLQDIIDEAYILVSPSAGKPLSSIVHRLAVKIDGPITTYKLIYDMVQATLHGRMPVFVSDRRGLGLPSLDEVIITSNIFDSARFLHTFQNRSRDQNETAAYVQR